MKKIGVIGAGGWGIALACLLVDNGHEVTIWSHKESDARRLREERENKTKLPGIRIPDAMEVTSDLKEAVLGKELLVLAVPSTAMRETAAKIKPLYEKGQVLVSVSKGIEEASLKTMSEIIEDEIPGVVVAALSGPSHAEEVGRKLPTTCVAGSADIQTAQYVQELFMSPVFRVYTSTDILGIELGGALKNVIALAAGVADGMGYGDNTKAALITRGIAEITRLGTAMGAQPTTFSGLSGIGDLIVTCASVHSRNRKAGYLMGQGYTMQEAMDEVNMVVEGVHSAKAARKLADKYQVEMPIIREVNRLLFEDKKPTDAVNDLMLRMKKDE